MLSVSRDVLGSIPTNGSFDGSHLQTKSTIMTEHVKVILTIRNNDG